MIRKFSKYTGNIFAKLLLLILSASFLFWGIGDVFNSSAQGQYLLRVGKRSVGVQEYQQQLNAASANYRQLLGAEYSPEMIKRLGVPLQVLNNLVNGLLLQEEAESLGIALSDEEVIALIRENEAFRGSHGFDKNLMQAMLQRAGMSEADYVASLRKETASGLLLEHLDGAPLVNNTLLETLYRVRAETREAQALLFSPEDITLPAPTAEALKAFYAKEKDTFRTQEYRRLHYVVVSPEKLRKAIKPSATELRNLYESRKESYRIPEKRKVLQLLYGSKKEALSAHNLIQQGVSLAEVAQKIAPTNKEHSLGFITRAELVEEAREDVFALPKGSASGVIATAFGWHIFKVSAIKPSALPSLSAIEPQLRKELTDAALEDKLYQLSIDLEDRITAGETLKDAAKSLNLPLRHTGYFDASGDFLEEEDAEAFPLPPVKNLLKRAFSPEMESAPEFQNGSDGKYYFVTLRDRKPPSLPAFEEVEKRVLRRWKKAEATRLLSEKVMEIASALRKGQADVAKALPHRIEETGKLSRSGARVDESDVSLALPPALVQELFTLSTGKATQAYPMENGDWAIATLTKTNPFTAKKVPAEALEALRNEMSEQYSNELTELYLMHLRQKYKVDVNQAAMQAVLK